LKLSSAQQAAEIRAAGGKAEARVADVRQRAEVDALIDDTVASHGQLDVLHNNAGGGNTVPFLELSDETYLGDIALSWPAVLRQSAEYRHPVEVEAALLSVHGLLHLLGWDHATPAEEREMWRLTRAALAAAGISEVGAGRL